MSRPRERAPAVRALALIAAVGPIAYILLTIVLGLLWGGYDPIRDTQSELGAVDSPYQTTMNVAGFMGLGVVILAFAGAYHLGLRDGWAKPVAAGLLVLAGAGMIVVGFFPCDPACVDVTRTGRLHGTFSMPGAIGLPVATMLSSLVFRSDGRFGTAWQAVSFWLGLLALASGPIVQAGWLDGVLGLLQRVGMWAPLLWMTAVSLRLYVLGSSVSSARCLDAPVTPGEAGDMLSSFVPVDFEPPEPPASEEFVLEPLGPEHNERDHAAWTSSIEHIRRTPGFPWEGWPTPMSLEDNRGDLEQHAADFAARTGFTYTVLSPVDRDVIGCVYVYPGRESGYDASVRSWVRASHARLDEPLWRAVSGWLSSEWPFEQIDYASRRSG